MKKLVLIVALAILNFSCSKDDEPNEAPSKSKLATFTQNDGIDYAITYNGETPTGIETDGVNGNIINPIIFNTLGNVTNVGAESYLYNANNLINRVVTGDNNQNCVLEYNGQNQLVRQSININDTNNDGIYNCIRNFTYTGNRVTTIRESSTLYYSGGPTYSSDNKFDLSYDAKGNIVQLLKYEKNLSGNYVVTSTTSYTYDDKPNPWKELLADKIYKNQFVISNAAIVESKPVIAISNFAYFKIFYINNNNFIKVKTESNFGSILENNYENTYNSENYITNITTVTIFNSQIERTLYNSYSYN